MHLLFRIYRLLRASLSASVTNDPDDSKIYPWLSRVGTRSPARSRGRSTDLTSSADTKPSTLATGTQLPSVGKFATRSSFRIEDSSQARNSCFRGSPISQTHPRIPFWQQETLCRILSSVPPVTPNPQQSQILASKHRLPPLSFHFTAFGSVCTTERDFRPPTISSSVLGREGESNLMVTSVDAFQYAQAGTFTFNQRSSSDVHNDTVSEFAAGLEVSFIFL